MLSKPWLSLWTSLPVLHFDRDLFRLQRSFDRFFNKVLSFHDRNAKLNTLTFSRPGDCTIKTLRKVLDYGFSQGVMHLEIIIWGIKELKQWPGDASSDSLTSLKLYFFEDVSCPVIGSFKNLTVLYLGVADISPVEPFSGFPLLEKLTLFRCRCSNETLTVESLKLSDLNITDTCFNRCELTTPNLRFFECKGPAFPDFQTHLPLIETVLMDLCRNCNVGYKYCWHQHEEIKFEDLISLFSAINNVKSFTLLSYTIDTLGLFSKKLVNSPFCNLKCLNFDVRCKCKHHNLFGKPRKCWFEIPEDVKAYLLHKSPDARFKIISDECSRCETKIF